MVTWERAGMAPLFSEAGPPGRINWEPPKSFVELKSTATCAFFPSQNPRKVTRSRRELALEMILCPNTTQKGQVHPR